MNLERVCPCRCRASRLLTRAAEYGAWGSPGVSAQPSSVSGRLSASGGDVRLAERRRERASGGPATLCSGEGKSGQPRAPGPRPAGSQRSRRPCPHPHGGPQGGWAVGPGAGGGGQAPRAGSCRKEAGRPGVPWGWPSLLGTWGSTPGRSWDCPCPPRLTALESPVATAGQRRSGGDLGVVGSEPTSAGDLRLQLLPGGPPGRCLTAPRGVWGVSPLPRGPTWPRAQGPRP